MSLNLRLIFELSSEVIYLSVNSLLSVVDINKLMFSLFAEVIKKNFWLVVFSINNLGKYDFDVGYYFEDVNSINILNYIGESNYKILPKIMY